MHGQRSDCTAWSGPWCQIGHKALEDFLQSDDFKSDLGAKIYPKLRLLPYILDTRLPASDYQVPEGIYDKRQNTPYEENQPPTKKLYYTSKCVSILM